MARRIRPLPARTGTHYRAKARRLVAPRVGDDMIGAALLAYALPALLITLEVGRRSCVACGPERNSEPEESDGAMISPRCSWLALPTAVRIPELVLCLRS